MSLSKVVPAVGRQYESKKDSMPSYSFGTGALRYLAIIWDCCILFVQV